jgi:hypothetical protein
MAFGLMLISMHLMHETVAQQNLLDMSLQMKLSLMRNLMSLAFEFLVAIATFVY